MTDIFIAYSHEDLAFKNELKKFLAPMLREGRISVWDDYDIEAGQEWDAKIKERLYGAGVILLLVSADSLASDYFYGKEVKVSLERHNRGEAVVVPVILRHCDWENTPLGGLEAVPEKGRPVVEWPTRDQAWQDTVSRLRKVVEGVETRRATASARAEAQRRYQAAVEAANHLFARNRWTEARTAFADALALHQAGFSPDKAQIEQQITDCDRQHHAETRAALAAESERLRLAEKQQREAAERQRAEQERQKEAERQRREEDLQRQKAEVEAEKRRNRAQAGQSPAPTRLWLYAALGIAVLVIAWIAFRPGGAKPDPGPTPGATNAPLERLDNESYRKALGAGTIPALDGYLTRYPAGKNAADARQELGRLRKRYRELLNDADLFRDDDPATACGYLHDALNIAPGDAAVLKKMRELKCK